tara:strand:- start:1213 stop:1359 length:147 start_codon:yes stop_codon:yes gene_type:complete
MKSQNILVTQNYQLKIADFGTARFAVKDREIGAADIGKEPARYESLFI